jgi:hypothetical protein
VWTYSSSRAGSGLFALPFRSSTRIRRIFYAHCRIRGNQRLAAGSSCAYVLVRIVTRKPETLFSSSLRRHDRLA